MIQIMELILLMQMHVSAVRLDFLAADKGRGLGPKRVEVDEDILSQLNLVSKQILFVSVWPWYPQTFKSMQADSVC